MSFRVTMVHCSGGNRFGLEHVCVVISDLSKLILFSFIIVITLFYLSKGGCTMVRSVEC